MEDNKKIIDEVTLKEDGGNVNISDDVVAAIAGIAASEIDGVYCMSGSVAAGIAEKLGAKKSLQKGVKVDIKPEGSIIDLYLTVEFGVRIPELSWNIQENVKNSVETMTGISISKVNIHIDGVHFKDEEKPSKKTSKKQEKPETEAAPDLLDGLDLSEEE
ncbi:MAG: Asp23/Gls24 family envelope stress response protein [Clostridia bacterium]|nr:Asp23/Gls24 family envelope stress response protein [Clostridia bacterium]